MTTTRAALLALALTTALPAAAIAQSTDDDPATAAAESEASPAKGKRAGKAKQGKSGKKGKSSKRGKPAEAPAPEAGPSEPAEAPLPSYDESGAPAGASENPGAPQTTWSTPAPAPVAATPVEPTRVGYPIERIYRPLVLPRRTFEVGLDGYVAQNPGRLSGQLRGRFGITDRVQAGLRYGTGSLTSDEYVTGKAFAVDVEVLVFPWLSGQLSFPFMVDPYSQGITFGAPIKFAFVDRFSIEVLRDLVTVGVKRFAPSVPDAAYDAGQLALDATNTTLSDGELNMGFDAIYQFEPNVAGDARFAYHLLDFESNGAPVELTVGATWSPSADLDLGARIGFLDLGDVDDTFVAQILASFRR